MSADASGAQTWTNRRVIFAQGETDNDSPKTDLHITSYAQRHVRSYADNTWALVKEITPSAVYSRAIEADALHSPR